MLSKEMKRVYQSVWSEQAHYETGMLEPDDGEVLEGLIYHDGRIMSIEEYKRGRDATKNTA